MDPFSPFLSLGESIARSFFSEGSPLAHSVAFFVYDFLKILVLIVAINFLVSAFSHYFPAERAKSILSKRRGLFGLDYFLAALLGVVTPFCSCSSIPLFLGFLRAGIPLGVTFSFLIASPLVNESSLWLFPAVFGLKATILYNVLGILVAVLGGYAIGKLGLEGEIAKGLSLGASSKKGGGKKASLSSLAWEWWESGLSLSRKMLPYVALGTGVGALIHGFVPETFVSKALSSAGIFAVPLAVLLGAPFYAGSVSVLPIVEALIGKGVPFGTALAFMTSVVAVSLPEILILRKAMGTRLILAFLSITLLGITLIGYFFNAISLS